MTTKNLKISSEIYAKYGSDGAFLHNNNVNDVVIFYILKELRELKKMGFDTFKFWFKIRSNKQRLVTISNLTEMNKELFEELFKEELETFSKDLESKKDFFISDEYAGMVKNKAKFIFDNNRNIEASTIQKTIVMENLVEYTKGFKTKVYKSMLLELMRKKLDLTTVYEDKDSSELQNKITNQIIKDLNTVLSKLNKSAKIFKEPLNVIDSLKDSNSLNISEEFLPKVEKFFSYNEVYIGEDFTAKLITTDNGNKVIEVQTKTHTWLLTDSLMINTLNKFIIYKKGHTKYETLFDTLLKHKKFLMVSEESLWLILDMIAETFED